jgi:hypothetical protein
MIAPGFRAWIAVASAEHVALGRAGGFMQVCHGKAAPLRRIAAGDGVVYYSPTRAFGGKDKLQAFTAIGIVKEGEPYCTDMGGGFRPFRRDVEWRESIEAPVRPMLSNLAFAARSPNWGYRLRLGLFEIPVRDFTTVTVAMTAAR